MAGLLSARPPGRMTACPLVGGRGMSGEWADAEFLGAARFCLRLLGRLLR